MSKALAFFSVSLSFISFISTTNAQRIYGAEVYKEILVDYVNIEAWVWRQGGSKPFIMYDWGDGSPLDTVPLFTSLPLGFYEGEYYYLDIYEGTHPFDTTGIFIMGFRDSFLVDDIVNIENSGSKCLEVFDTIAIYPQSTGSLSVNTTPVFFTQQGNVNIVNNNAVFFIDLESDEYLFGDLYRCELVPFPAEGYSLPEASDSIYMSPPVGAAMIWDDPIAPGRYAVGINVIEERRKAVDGVIDTFFLSTTMRAMTMIITEDLLLTSIPEYNNMPSLVSIYPSPATSIVNIDFALPGKEGAVNILSTSGQLMYNRTLQGNDQVQTLNVSVKDWPAGAYLAEFILENGQRLLKKFVVVR